MSNIQYAIDRAARNNSSVHSAPEQWESWNSGQQVNWMKDTINDVYQQEGGRTATNDEVQGWIAEAYKNTNNPGLGNDGAMTFLESKLSKAISNASGAHGRLPDVQTSGSTTTTSGGQIDEVDPIITTTTTTTPTTPITQVQTNSQDFINDTYNPDSSYENYTNPANQSYSPNYSPQLPSYFNDISTSYEPTGYTLDNIRGLDDREHTIENPGAFLNNYIFNMINEPHSTPSNSMRRIGQSEKNYYPYGDDDEFYGPYEQYSPERYY